MGGSRQGSREAAIGSAGRKPDVQPAPARSRGRKTKVAREVWVETAKRVLIEEGVAGVRVDRLASRLGVTRGGFYHNFEDRDALLTDLLAAWSRDCRFLPEQPVGAARTDAVAWLEKLAHQRIIDEDGYDHRFDMAVREWSRSDQRAAWAIERADRLRMEGLRTFFKAIGCTDEDAHFRARIFYYHQIGYYAIGVRESAAERHRNAGRYIEALCGAALAATPAGEARPAAPRRRRGA